MALFFANLTLTTANHLIFDILYVIFYPHKTLCQGAVLMWVLAIIVCRSVRHMPVLCQNG